MRINKSIATLMLLLAAGTGRAQHFPVEIPEQEKEELKVIYIHKDVSTHLISPEEIKYVDISIPDIAGDLAMENTLRVKPVKEGASGVVTIITERSFVQYLLVYSDDIGKSVSRYNIPYSDVRSYMNAESGMTRSEMFDYAYRMFTSGKKFFDVSTKRNGMRIRLNNIYTLDKYFFIDLSLLNKTNIKYDIDQLRFKLEDKKQVKAANSQAIELFPSLRFSNAKDFKKKYRNIFVFEKFTFPDEKVFTIEVAEKQISGRTITLRIDYSDILHADSYIK